MSRYIDADLIVFEESEYGPILDYATRTSIELTPTADVMEVKHGYVIEHKGHEDEYCCECSVCGTHEVSLEDKYCSECGAKMDGDKTVN